MQLTKSEFEEKWLEAVRQGRGFMEAFDFVNDWHMRTFGDYRYVSYTSFRQSRDYRPRR